MHYIPILRFVHIFEIFPAKMRWAMRYLPVADISGKIQAVYYQK